MIGHTTPNALMMMNKKSPAVTSGAFDLMAYSDNVSVRPIMALKKIGYTMALYKDYHIDGGDVLINTDGITAVINTNDAVWLWSDNGNYFCLSIEGGKPVTRASTVDNDGNRESRKVLWADRVEGK